MLKIKICGITNIDDAAMVVECGADMLGFIFVDSPRKVEPELVKDIAGGLPKSVIKVGVFMDQELAEIRDIMTLCNLDMTQLHGNESPDFCAKLGGSIIKAFTPQTLPNMNQLKDYPVDAFMLDRQKGVNTPPKELWPIAREMTQYGKVILAGAQLPENVGEAIRAVQPYGVDVASGVEIEPGKKDPQKVRDFIREVRRNQGETTG